MAWLLAPALVTFRRQINTEWPNRNKDVDGTIGDTAHQNRVSDHNPDADNVVTAVDITDDDSVGADMRVLAETLRLARDPRNKYTIHEGKMFSSYPTSQYPAWTWRPYNGLNGHFSHLHLSVTQEGKYDNSEWRLNSMSECVCGLSAEEIAFVKQLVAATKSVGSNAGFVVPTVELIRREREIPLHPH